jgi:hypothetical protein
MKYSDVIEAAPRMALARDQAAMRVGAAQLFALMKNFEWIQPILRKDRMTLFDSREVDSLHRAHHAQRISRRRSGAPRRALEW